MTDRITKAIVPLLVPAACLLIANLPREMIPGLVAASRAIGPYGYAFVMNTIWIVVPLAALVIQRRSLSKALGELGIATNPLRPLLFGFVATLPATIGFALTGHVNHDMAPRAFFLVCLYAPFAEELLFRAFAFGQLYRRAGWSFRGAMIIPAILFAAGHVHQSSDPAEIAGIVAITALGAFVFSYFFVRLGWTIWAPFALHALLNTLWFVFTPDKNALGGVSENIFRFGSIGLAFLIAFAATRVSAFRVLAPKEGMWRSAQA
jgi:membrane protease YdiL (CAAX protease family)